MRPSGRTVTSPVMSVSRQKLMPRTSCGPITYSAGTSRDGPGWRLRDRRRGRALAASARTRSGQCSQRSAGRQQSQRPASEHARDVEIEVDMVLTLLESEKREPALPVDGAEHRRRGRFDFRSLARRQRRHGRRGDDLTLLLLVRDRVLILVTTKPAQSNPLSRGCRSRGRPPRRTRH